ncbi:MAG: HipA domain-containing protein [Proteobacteria bacterium]|nr:HipA domain-containing protein [Pseudomonadota bacterium]
MSKYKFIDLSQVINIDGWETDSTDPGGSRSKKTVFEKDSKNLYIFKEPKVGREAQIWSELIASYIAGDLLGWSVQQSKIAISNGKAGNLLEYIYNKKLDGFMHGEAFCKAIDRTYDVKAGRRHTWQLIKKIGKKDMIRQSLHKDYFQFWARAIAFDTLISNTDRHAQNWSVIIKDLLIAFQKPGKIDPSKLVMKMAPLYDNAASMGCEHNAKGLEKWFDKDKIKPEKIKNYIENGRHHLSNRETWHYFKDIYQAIFKVSLQNKQNRFPFEALCQRVLTEYPQTRTEFESIATLDLSRLDPILNDIMAMTGLPKEARLSKKQAEVIMALLQAGQDRVKNSLEKTKK